jgi:hypothetical protein
MKMDNKSEMTLVFDGVEIKLEGPAKPLVAIANRITNTDQPKGEIESLVSMVVSNPGLIKQFQGEDSIDVDTVLPIVERFFPQAAFLKSLPGAISLFKRLKGGGRKRSKKQDTELNPIKTPEDNALSLKDELSIPSDRAVNLDKARSHRLNVGEFLNAPIEMGITSFSSKEARASLPSWYSKKKHHEVMYALVDGDLNLIEGSETGSGDGVFSSSDDAGEKKDEWAKAKSAFAWIIDKSSNKKILARTAL